MTGVQTCALPIFGRGRRLAYYLRLAPVDGEPVAAACQRVHLAVKAPGLVARAAAVAHVQILARAGHAEERIAGGVAEAKPDLSDRLRRRQAASVRDAGNSRKHVSTARVEPHAWLRNCEACRVSRDLPRHAGGEIQ